MELVDLEELGSLAVSEYPSLVRTFCIIDNKLRILLTDNSFIDFWWSTQLPGRYAHHWERRHVDGTIYRYDNAPLPSGNISKHSLTISISKQIETCVSAI